MKTIKFILGSVLVICIFLTPSCLEEESADLQTLPTLFIVDKLSLGEIASDLLFIPLENNEPLSQIKDIKWYGHFFYISTRKGQICKFTIDGKLVQIFDKIGNGPGEYLGINGFFFDSEGNIYINTRKKIVVYNNKFEFLRDIKYPENIEIGEIYLKDDYIFLFQNATKPIPEYDWVVLDTKGKIQYKKPFLCYDKPPFGVADFTLSVFENNGKLYRQREISDTIFEITHKNFFPAYKVNRIFRDGFRLRSKEEISRAFSFNNLWPGMDGVKFRLLVNIQGVGDFWILNYIARSDDKATYETVLFETSTNKMLLANRSEFVHGSPLFNGLPNDWVGSGSILPISTIEIGNEKYAVASMEAIKLKNQVESEEFQRGTPKRPEIKQRMREIADTLSVGDNPVLILLKLR